MKISVATSTKNAIIDMVYQQTIRMSISHPVAAAFAVFWYSDVAPLAELLVWFSAVATVTCLRVCLFVTYNSKKHIYTNMWMHFAALASFITGAIYAFGFIYFTPITQDKYIVVAGLFAVSMSAAAVIGYGASIYAILSFSIPVVVPTTIYFMFFAGDTGFITGLTLSFFAVVVMSLVSQINDAYKRSLSLNFQNKVEIERRKLVEHKLQEISRMDSLTGVFNRRYFDEILDVEIGRAYRNHTSLCLLMFDIDFFKEYNDCYGHVAGDNCLIKVADIASKLACRKGDLLARYGGEEFAIILPNIDLKGANAFAKKLQMAIQNHEIEHSSSPLTSLKVVTISVGVSNLTPFTKMKAGDLLEETDRALYEAKKLGRNRVHCFENKGIWQDFS